MNIAATFNPLDFFNTFLNKYTGTFNMGSQDGSNVVIINESQISLILTFGNGAQAYVPANARRLFYLAGQMSQPNPNVSWTGVSIINVANVPLPSVVTVETYYWGEDVPETYPTPLFREFTPAGLVVASVLTSTSHAPSTVDVINISNATDFPALKTTELDNQGNLVLGNATHPGSLSVVGTLSTDSAKINSDGLSHFTIGAIAQSIYQLEVLSSADTIVAIMAMSHSATQSADLIQAQLSDSTVVFRVTSKGQVCIKGTTAVLATNGTIDTSKSFTKPNPAGAVTGIIMSVGLQDGQLCVVNNIGVGSITFAVAGSNVKEATVGIASGNTNMFMWSITDSLWHRINVS